MLSLAQVHEAAFGVVGGMVRAVVALVDDTPMASMWDVRRGLRRRVWARVRSRVCADRGRAGAGSHKSPHRGAVRSTFSQGRVWRAKSPNFRFLLAPYKKQLLITMITRATAVKKLVARSMLTC